MACTSPCSRYSETVLLERAIMKNFDTKCFWLGNLYECPGVTLKFVSNQDNVKCISSLLTHLRVTEYLGPYDLHITIGKTFLSDCAFPLKSIWVEN